MSDVSFEQVPLPSSWRWIAIADLEPEFQNGESSRGQASGIPTIVLRLADIANGKISLSAPRTLQLPAASLQKYSLRKGDILVIRVNGSTQLVGQFVLATVDQVAYCDHFIRMRVPARLADPRYLTFLASSSLVRRQVERAFVSTAGQKTINQRHIRSIAIPLAPRAEQRRIVATIEEQLSRLDAGIAALHRARQNLKRIRTAVLEASVPSGQGVSDVALADLVAPGSKIAYGVLVPGDHVADGVPLVRVGDLSNRQVSTAGLKRIAPGIAARYARTRLQGGEVLLSLVGTIGRTAVAPLSLAGANTARALAVIPLQEAVDPRYVAIALSRDRVTRELTELSHEVARKTLNLEDIRRYKIPLPSYAKQVEIVKAVETSETWIASIEDTVAATMRHAEQLRSSILSAAFAGKLVPQNQSDEPSIDLLDRIASEGTSSKGKGSTGIRRPRVQREKIST